MRAVERGRSRALLNVLALLVGMALSGCAHVGKVTTDLGGKVITNLGVGLGKAHALVLQPDGKLVAAGRCRRSRFSDGKEFCLARYNPDGSLDVTFDGDGKVSTDLGALSDWAHALVLQPDSLVADFREWGIYVSDLAVLWQLTVQPSLIVEVWPMSIDDFSLRYGLRPDQFAALATEGFVIPNLYHYDRDRAAGFAKHEARGNTLMPISVIVSVLC